MNRSRHGGFIFLVLALIWIFGFWGFTWQHFLDDSYIGFTYIRNCVEGNGFVFNLGERVEGVTNIGWLLFLLPWAFLIPVPVVAKVVSLVLVLSTIALTYTVPLGILKNKMKLYRLIVILCIATSFEFLYFSFSGMETSLLACLFGIVIHAVLLRRYIIASAVMAVAFAVRPEVLPVLPFWVVLCVVSRAMAWRKLVYCALVYVFLIAIIEAGRDFYFGALLPNTFAAKPTSFDTLFVRLADLPNRITEIKNISLPFSSVIVILLMGVGCYRLIRHGHGVLSLFLACVAGTGFLFSVYAGEDWTGLGRYFAPYIPISFMLFVIGVFDLVDSLQMDKLRKQVVLLGISSALIFAGMFDSVYWLRSKIQDKYPWYVASSYKLIPAARWISQNTPLDARIATRRIGCLAFYGRRYVFDYKFGLTDKCVADMISKRSRGFELPTDDPLADVWHQRNPDYLIEETYIIQLLGCESNSTSFMVHGLLYAPVKIFKINKETEWVLCGRLGVSESGGNENDDDNHINIYRK